MKNIFIHGDFSSYRTDGLSHSIQLVESRKIEFSTEKTTVFISHKHGELEDLADVIAFLETQYNVRTYIDSRDLKMPEVPNEETALRIKEKIESCEKFILLATDAAIQSKWCNWELGYGDAQKFKTDNIALMPIGKRDSTYTGNEYLAIYPYIVKRVKGDTYSDETPIIPGYYIRRKNKDGSYNLTELKKWLQR